MRPFNEVLWILVRFLAVVGVFAIVVFAMLAL
jgi:hypothetical protein